MDTDILPDSETAADTYGGDVQVETKIAAAEDTAISNNNHNSNSHYHNKFIKVKLPIVKPLWDQSAKVARLGVTEGLTVVRDVTAPSHSRDYIPANTGGGDTTAPPPVTATQSSPPTPQQQQKLQQQSKETPTSTPKKVSNTPQAAAAATTLLGAQQNFIRLSDWNDGTTALHQMLTN